MTRIVLFISIALVFYNSLVWADSVQVSRYAEASALPNEQQMNPIKTIASFDFPGSITKVGEAVQIVLVKSGFRLSTTSNPHHNVLFNFSLPAVHRQIGPMSIENILKALAGPAYLVVIDQRFRTVSFILYSARTTPEEVAGEGEDHCYLADHKEAQSTKTSRSFVEVSHEELLNSGHTGISAQPEKSTVTTYFVLVGDTLSSIGKDLGASNLSHFIETVYRQNIHAFYNSDKDDLKIASVLTIPTEALL